MSLQHITATTCPECGAPTASESCDFDGDQHVFESRQFTCDGGLRWRPTGIEQGPMCPAGQAFVARMQQHLTAYQQLAAFTATLAIDEQFQRDLQAGYAAASQHIQNYLQRPSISTHHHAQRRY